MINWHSVAPCCWKMQHARNPTSEEADFSILHWLGLPIVPCRFCLLAHVEGTYFEEFLHGPPFRSALCRGPSRHTCQARRAKEEKVEAGLHET